MLCYKNFSVKEYSLQNMNKLASPTVGNVLMQDSSRLQVQNEYFYHKGTTNRYDVTDEFMHYWKGCFRHYFALSVRWICLLLHFTKCTVHLQGHQQAARIGQLVEQWWVWSPAPQSHGFRYTNALRVCFKSGKDPSVVVTKALASYRRDHGSILDASVWDGLQSPDGRAGFSLGTSVSDHSKMTQ